MSICHYHHFASRLSGRESEHFGPLPGADFIFAVVPTRESRILLSAGADVWSR